MAGSLTGAGADGSAVTIEKVAIGSTVITGTKESPIVIDGSVLIKGDLVIKGPYKGVGSVYVTGIIYIPGNITATESVFPFPANPSKTLTHHYTKQALIAKRAHWSPSRDST